MNDILSWLGGTLAGTALGVAVVLFVAALLWRREFGEWPTWKDFK